MKHYMPTRILTGFGILQKNRELIQKLGKRCLIITSKHSGRSSGALNDLSEILEEASVEYEVFDEIAQNPTVASCIEAGRCAHSFQTDYIVGMSKARFKVSTQLGDQAYADFILQFSTPAKGVGQIIGAIRQYLSNIAKAQAGMLVMPSPIMTDWMSFS